MKTLALAYLSFYFTAFCVGVWEGDMVLVLVSLAMQVFYNLTIARQL